MRVAIVVPGGVDASGEDRVIPALVWLIERLARRHDVHVFAMQQESEPAQWELRGAHVENIGTGGFRRLRFLSRLAVAHRAAPFDVVHAFFGGVGALASIAALRHQLPFVLHLAGGEPVAIDALGYGSRLSLRGRIGLRVAVAGARRVTVATHFMRTLVGKLGIDAEVVPLGVAVDRWPVRQPRPRHANGTARLLHIGDLRPVKAQDVLLDAVVMLVRQGVDVHLDIAGFDTMNGKLQRSAAAIELGDRVRFHGLLRRDALRRLVLENDLLLHTSMHEAGPLCVLEAAVAGVPTVGTNVGQVCDWAPDAAVGIPVGDADAMARSVASLLSDEPRRIRLAREAQARAIRQDADFTAAEFERIYGEVTSVRRKTSSAARP